MAIYHQTFDADGVCHEGTVSELGDVVGGATPSTDNPAKTAKVFSERCKSFFTQQMLYEQELTQLFSLASIRVSSIAKGA